MHEVFIPSDPSDSAVYVLSDQYSENKFFRLMETNIESTLFCDLKGHMRALTATQNMQWESTRSSRPGQPATFSRM